jgi:hypothetical protein
MSTEPGLIFSDPKLVACALRCAAAAVRLRYERAGAARACAAFVHNAQRS